MTKAFFKIAIYGFLLFFLGENLHAQTLAAVKRGDKWFYIDKNGKIAINQLFEGAGERFENRLAPVKIKGKWGYISPSGKMLIKPRYLQAKCFNKGGALVQMVQKKDTSWYLIDTKGNVTKKLQLKNFETDTFTDGIYMVETPQGKAYILPSGKILHAPQGLSEIYPFYNGLARIRKGTKYGFLDTSGNIKIDFKYDGATNFREGKSCVSLNSFYYLIDTGGNKVLDLKYLEDVAEFTNGIALARMSGKYYIYNYIKNTTTETSLEYSKKWLNFLAYPYNYGWARFWAHDLGTPLKYNFIDINGKEAPLYFEFAGDFNEEMAIVKQNGHYGYIDVTGKIVIECLYDDVKPFFKVR